MDKVTYKVFRNKRGGITVTLNNYAIINNEFFVPGDLYNNHALTALSYDRPQWSRSVDTNLLAAQYVYSEDSAPWEGVRPSCTRGSIGSGFCTNDTEYGDILCADHGGIARHGVTFD